MAEERSASVDATLCNLERREKYLLHRRARAVETMAKRKIVRSIRGEEGGGQKGGCTAKSKSGQARALGGVRRG